MEKIKLDDLNRMYTEADDADRDIFAEQRSHILLIAGDHYSRKLHRTNSRLKEDKSYEAQRLRLTKNHIHKVYRHYVANILSFAPGVAIVPANDHEIQDQKDAQMNMAVWTHFKSKYKLRQKTRQFAQDFVGIGEVAVKVFWDPHQGDLMGYEPKLQMSENDEPMMDDFNQPLYEMDERGQQVADESKPIFSGAMVFERIFGFNLMREPGTKSMEESSYLIVRKMVSTERLKKMYADSPEIQKGIEETKDDTFIIFDSSKGEYDKSKKETLVREFYWKPCHEYPEGYFVFATENRILEQGPLPFGIYPIVYQGFDEFPTAPRGRSIIKQVRPPQAELNRASSAQAQHQVTIGDDKILYQAGTKLSPGALLPGVRGITFAGVVPPTILPGRDGSQYMPYIDAQRKEIYDIAELEEENRDMPAQVDAYAMLFASMRQQKKFAIYGEKFEQFLIDLCELALNLAKQYLPDDALIYAVGRNEQVNVPEFRNTSKLCYQIKVEPRNETAEDQMGKQLTMNHILQYVGPNLGKDEIGKIIRNMPFGNTEEAFRDFTLDYDVVRNDHLALERGEYPQINQYDTHEYFVKRTTARMREPDFKFLKPEVQMGYQQYLKAHEQALADQAAKLAAAKSEFIPVNGAMIATDLYVPNPQDPTKAAKRVRIPYTALDWLVKKLENQGIALDQIEKMNQGAVVDIASLMPQASPSQGMSGSPVSQPPSRPPSSGGSGLGVS